MREKKKMKTFLQNVLGEDADIQVKSTSQVEIEKKRYTGYDVEIDYAGKVESCTAVKLNYPEILGEKVILFNYQREEAEIYIIKKKRENERISLKRSEEGTLYKGSFGAYQII